MGRERERESFKRASLQVPDEYKHGKDLLHEGKKEKKN